MTKDKGKENGHDRPEYALPERDLIVVAEAGVELSAASRPAGSPRGADVAGLDALLAQERISLEPVFGPSVARTRAAVEALSAQVGVDAPDLSVYFRVRAEDDRLDVLASSLAALPGVKSAYVKPPAEPAPRNDIGVKDRARSREAVAELPPVTPDFTADQGYLGPAPAGVDAQYAATIAGGRGTGVGIIDIEGAWNFAHEDLLMNQGGVVGGTPTADQAWRDHGTAVVGEFGGDINGFGVTGIAPDANVRAISIFGGVGSSGAIHQAATLLNAGDIILIELHRPGPRHNFEGRLDQRGYIAIEWWPDDFDAIRFATSKGVIVVEAAGNGAENLSDALYDTPAAGFPATWRNPFNPINASSLAVLVGAGAPPPGTHGVDHGPDRSRLDFSNHGARVDAQGWGREVTTTGYGDLQGGAENVFYTDTFSGTSSASPIVVGALACIQGIQRAAGRALLTPADAIALLRATGSPQQDGPNGPASQRIGNRPDLRAAIAQLGASALESGVAASFWDEEIAYPAGTAASLWLLVNGAWRRRDSASAHQRTMIQRAFATTGAEVRVWYQGEEIVGLVVAGA